MHFLDHISVKGLVWVADDTTQLETVDHLYRSSFDEDRECSPICFNNQLFYLADIKSLFVVLIPWCKVLSLFRILHLIVVDPAENSDIISKFKIALALYMTTKSWLYKE